MSGSMKWVLLIVAVLVPVAILGSIFYLLVRSEPGAEGPCPLCDAVATEDPAAVVRVLDAGAPMDERAWFAALQNLPKGGDGPVGVARLLAEHGADPNYSWRFSSSSRSGSSPAGQWAAARLCERTDDPSVVDILVSHGLDVKGQAGAEALVAAAALGREHVVKRLLEAGVPSDAKGGFPQRTALSAALQSSHPGTVAVLEAAGASER